MTSELIKIFDRDIARLKSEIEAFTNEDNLWRTAGTTKNPAGNLCLHLTGNLRTYIGKNLGNFDYVRDREAEFSRTGIPKQELVQLIEDTRMVVGASLKNLDEMQLQETYVEELFGAPMSNGFFLIHLIAHLSYHLGQVNYLRRVLE